MVGSEKIFKMEVVMSTRLITITALIAALAAPLATADEINPVLGKVADFSITEIDLERIVATQSPETQQQFAAKPELKAGLIQELLLKKAIARQARKEGYDKKPDFREQLSFLVDDFLTREYMSKAVLAGITVPEEEMQKYYKEHEKDFLLPETVKLRHIFIKAAETATDDEKKKGLVRSEGLLKRLKQGEDFAKVAAEASEDTETAAKGGELGVISPGKTNSVEFEKAVFALKAGEISGIITTPYGYHIVRVDEKNAGRLATLAEAKSYIINILKKELEQKSAREFMEKIAKESGLEVFSDRISGVKTESSGKKP